MSSFTLLYDHYLQIYICACSLELGVCKYRAASFWARGQNYQHVCLMIICGKVMCIGKKAILNVQRVSQVNIQNQKLCSYFKIPSKALELASQSYQ